MALSKAEILGQNTMYSKLGLWSANLRNNLNIINKCDDITVLNKLNSPVLCIAAGESMKLHYDTINKFKGKIVSCEKNLIPLLENNIIPDYIISIDGSNIMTHFIDSPIVRANAHRITGVFATTVSPEFVSKWNSDIIFFNAWLDDINETKSVSLVFQELTQKATMHTGGHCGATLWFLSYYLQANPIILLGVDLAYPISIPDLSYTSIWDWVKYLPKEEILKYYRRETNPFGEDIITDYVWDGFKDSWMSWINEMQEYKTIQCSNYTILYESPIIVKEFEDVLNEVNKR
jgi:hypothetical protein